MNGMRERGETSAAKTAGGRAPWLSAVALGLAVALLGLWPHLRFSAEHGSLLYYQSAYDEEYYASAAMSGSLRPDRLTGKLAVRALAGLAGPDLSLSLVAADAVLPFFAALAAYFLAGGVVSGMAQRMLVALLVLFGESLLNQGAMHIWPSAMVTWFQKLMDWSTVFPVHTTFFFSIFRSPEPQASLIWCFLVLGILARIARDRDPKTHLLLLCGLNACFPFIYAPCGVSVLLTQFLWIASLFFVKRNRGLAVRLLAAMAFAGAGFAIMLFQPPLNPPDEPPKLAFSSRLPVVTFSVVASCLLTVLQGLRLLRARPAPVNPRDALCLVCCALPAALLNQQIVTGRMTMVTPFELSFNAVVLFFGASFLLSSVVLAGGKMSRLAAGAATTGLALVVALVVWSQDRSYGMWLGYNYQVRAAVMAADAARAADGEKTPWLDGSDLALVMSVAFLRPEMRPVCLFSRLFDERFLANMGTPGFVPPSDNPMRDEVFEHWLRNGLTPEVVSRTLVAEAEAGSGLNINFFFSFQDSWKPFSLGRAVRREEIKAFIPDIVRDYATFFSDCRQADRTVIFLSTTPVRDDSAGPCLDVFPVAKGTVGTATVFAALQRAAARPATGGER
ncbi:hypothetical protein GD604_11425 [Desulfolutivibrio sulfoxidireducens]|nr:hypothetical protein GD604_11425 [Desulfolutivibrio sulfoxidireducens]